MKSFTSVPYIKHILLGVLLGASFSATIVFAQQFAQPTTGPTAFPSGSQPNENFYQPLVTTPAGQQQKVGKLGIFQAPTPSYDFRVEGLASFLGGVWASSGVFSERLCVGQLPVSHAFCPAGTANTSQLQVRGTFQSLAESGPGVNPGSGANIQNDALRHSTVLANGQPGLERVCSTTNGTLRLCSTTATQGTGTNQAVSLFCILNPTACSGTNANTTPSGLNESVTAPAINTGGTRQTTDGASVPVQDQTQQFATPTALPSGTSRTTSTQTADEPQSVSSFIVSYCVANPTDPICG
ncbi:MAG: hypothetical protein LRY41_03370 [Candidatus Pacebacteria bacterium]|nr:hypothetical protein [Candidatus Paceibacterota bacterium]MCD8508031.1 hypothetical protein [Candidatus Paceibacterota bacterium]MCD8528331.1 hypothetical protein [Candidatus Paceibacterota bacterium]MCD8563811.1 hypothetical protein [Candidatus Paceibacterota bacterium]